MKSVVCSAVNNMKDSGIKWLGMIPKHWNISALRYVSSLYTGNSISDEKKSYYTDPIDAIPYISTKDVDVNYQTINYNNGLYVKKNDSLFRVAPKGSVLMCIEGGSAGKKKAYTNQDVAFVNKLCCFLAGDSLFDKFLFYSLMSPSFEHNFNQYLTGIIGGVTIPVIKNIRICLPPLSEQRAIADWLDAKCADIDAAIELQQRMIDKLKAYKTAVIHQAVTKGLDKNTNLKDSGVQWIGEVPEHWEVCHLKRVVTINNGSDYKHCQVEPCIYPVIGSGGIFTYASSYIYDGEVLLLGRKGTIDKPMYYNGKFWTVDTMFYAVSNDNAICKYLYYHSMLIPFARFSTSTALPSMTQTDLKNNLICLPPLSEQCAIADWLDAKCADIDATIALKEQKQEKLKEYKKTIIFEYVTGKKQVTNINK